MKTKLLAVELPRIDGGTQSRIKINEDVVQEYADLISESKGEWPFPPIDVFHDGTDYFVGDGFHRLLGALRTKRGTVPCVIHNGTATDARIFGMTANDRHGLRMSRADKRACVEWLLDNGKFTQAEIAEKAGVTTRTVRIIVADRKPKTELPPRNCSRKTSGCNEGDAIPPQNEKPKHPDGESLGMPCPNCGTDWWVDDACGNCLEPIQGEDAEEEGTPEESSSRPSRNDTEKPAVDFGKCPACAGVKWTEDEDGVSCAKCRHPYGEPAGDTDEERLKTQRQKTVKTIEALMRAFDDLQTMLAKPEHSGVIADLKRHLNIAKGWK